MVQLFLQLHVVCKLLEQMKINTVILEPLYSSCTSYVDEDLPETSFFYIPCSEEGSDKLGQKLKEKDKKEVLHLILNDHGRKMSQELILVNILRSDISFGFSLVCLKQMLSATHILFLSTKQNAVL